MIKRIKNKKGFTLAELLIVVAIIAVLVAISIPIFTSQLEKAREATDAANIRSAYAEASAEVLDSNADASYAAQLTQTKAGFESDIKIGGKDLKEASSYETGAADIKNPNYVVVKVTTDGTVTFSCVETLPENVKSVN